MVVKESLDDVQNMDGGGLPYATHTRWVVKPIGSVLLCDPMTISTAAAVESACSLHYGYIQGYITIFSTLQYVRELAVTLYRRDRA